MTSHRNIHNIKITTPIGTNDLELIFQNIHKNVRNNYNKDKIHQLNIHCNEGKLTTS